jgi:2-desacetyl-2-hydroxyethyl bacteriochlorophyllide A dehydrogenase
MRARALQFVAPRRIEPTDVEVPVPAPGELLIRTLYSGISAGTELLAYRGEIDPGTSLDERIGPLAGTFSFPFRYGYSCVGRVQETKASAAAGPLVFAFHPHQDVFVAADSEIVLLPAMDPRIATLFPLVETALQIALDAGPVAEQLVVVTGLGPLGILAGLLLERAGAVVVGAEPRGWRRSIAESVGIHALAGDEITGAVEDRARGRGAPLLVECSGNPAALAGGLRLLAHEGTALVASWYGAKDVRLPLGAEFHRRRLTIRSTQVSTIPAHLSSSWTVERRREVSVGLMEELPLKRLATHEYPFNRAAEAFDSLDRGVPGLMHAALRYQPGGVA